jgi:hypothetical protein
MADFSVIAQSPAIRAIVQENLLERAFHDALFPKMLFRGEAEVVSWPAHVGDSMAFTGVGLMGVDMKPLTPGSDPLPSSYTYEQWTAQLNQYANSIDTNMPTSVNAIADLFLRNAQQLGLNAAQTLNRKARNALYNAAMAGSTMAAGAQSAVTSLRVLRIDGFTSARNPNLSGGSAVRFAPVSSSNPLAIVVNTGTLAAPSYTAVNVIGYTADTAGDEFGPGVLALSAAVTVVDQAGVLSDDRAQQVIVGSASGKDARTVDSIAAGDELRLKHIRAAVARFRQQNVPEYADGFFHCHLDPVSEAQIFNDDQFARLLTSLPDYYMYKQFSIGQLLGVAFMRNTECPVPETVKGAGTAYSGSGTYGYTVEDNFGGIVWNKQNVQIHRALFTGQQALHEYYQDLSQYISDAGLNGKTAAPQITNNGIEVFSDRIQLVMRAPLNRLQDVVSTSWKWVGDFVVRTDAATGDAARFKRELVVCHGE